MIGVKAEPRPRSNVIYVMGIDGSGKSTVCEFLEEHYASNGFSVKSVWLRFNHFFSKPLLAFGRISGLTEYKNVDGIRVGYHHFHRSKIVSQLFFWLQYLDARRARRVHIEPNMAKDDQVLILDRFVYDILIDVALDIDNPEIIKEDLARKFVDLLPENTIVIPVFRDRQALLDARPESTVDTHFEQRLDLYEAIVKHEKLPVLDNNGSIEELKQKALEFVRSLETSHEA